MEIRNVSYKNPDVWEMVYAVSGRPIPFFRSIMEGGSGSPRGVLSGGAAVIDEFLNETSNLKYVNMQRTLQGAILYFKVRLEVYGIPIPQSTPLSVQENEVSLFNGDLRFTFKPGERKAWKAFFLKAGWDKDIINQAFLD
ncbi:MAG: hypothetical protein RL226_1979 [Bacteroidota bacterium]